MYMRGFDSIYFIGIVDLNEMMQENITCVLFLFLNLPL